jgi:hypothetical protein
VSGWEADPFLPEGRELLAVSVEGDEHEVFLELGTGHEIELWSDWEWEGWTGQTT